MQMLTRRLTFWLSQASGPNLDEKNGPKGPISGIKSAFRPIDTCVSCYKINSVWYSVASTKRDSNQLQITLAIAAQT